MTVHNGLHITDMLQMDVRKSEKGTPSSSDEFASMLALYAGKESGSEGPNAVNTPETGTHGMNEKNGDAGIDDAKVSGEAQSPRAQQHDEHDDGEHDKKVNEKSKKAKSPGKKPTGKPETSAVKTTAGVKTGRKKIPALFLTEKKKAIVKKTPPHAPSLRDKKDTTDTAAGKKLRRLNLRTAKAANGLRVHIRKSIQSPGVEKGIEEGGEKKTVFSAKLHRFDRKTTRINGVDREITTRKPVYRNVSGSPAQGDSPKPHTPVHTVDPVPAALRYENLTHTIQTKTHYQFQKIADGNFDEIIRQFSLVLNRGGGEARIHLHPESLGELKLSIKLHNNEVSTNMLVDTQSVKDLILERLNILEESLQEQGFQLGSFEVEVKDRQNGSYEVSSTAVRGIGSPEEEINESESDKIVWTVPWMSTVINATV